MTGCTLFFLFTMILARAQEPFLTGNWFSKDGSRQYLIRQKETGWEAVLIHSDRENDTTGKLILSRVQKRRNFFRGYIYSVTDDAYTTVTIRVSRRNKEVLILKLKRMLLLDVTIKWYRTPV